MKFLIASIIAACSLGCGTVGSYAGMDLELGYDHSFIDNNTSGGKKEGHFFPAYTERDENNLGFKVRILLRPQGD